jgi:hypothetical protein
VNLSKSLDKPGGHKTEPSYVDNLMKNQECCGNSTGAGSMSPSVFSMGTFFKPFMPQYEQSFPPYGFRKDIFEKETGYES